MVIRGLVLLFGFQMLGEFVSRSFGLVIPGSVIGLMLLFVTFLFIPLPESVKVVSDHLIRYLGVFFMPAGVGLFYLPQEILGQWPALLAGMVLGTAVAILICALLLKWMTKL
ncbi:CidA/LrgA family protein [Sessilibacter corallicola]|uniref:CidA/LrgA family protein n=1 Tax=Sessilibacter corallicola TaxID=2904075 RepID=UPI001E3D2D26|nr:CidA/LrgA family protein [Sessilibacter corallicola]